MKELSPSFMGVSQADITASSAFLFGKDIQDAKVVADRPVTAVRTRILHSELHDSGLVFQRRQVRQNILQSSSRPTLPDTMQTEAYTVRTLGEKASELVVRSVPYSESNVEKATVLTVIPLFQAT